MLHRELKVGSQRARRGHWAGKAALALSSVRQEHQPLTLQKSHYNSHFPDNTLKVNQANKGTNSFND